jgi:hypothetical protein
MLSNAAAREISLKQDSARREFERGLEQLRQIFEHRLEDAWRSSAVSELPEPAAENKDDPETDVNKRILHLESELHETQEQSSRVMNLYVATYQLHATLDPKRVETTVGEIAVNLLGAKAYALLLRRPQQAIFDVIVSQQVDHIAVLQGQQYRGGDAAIDLSLSMGEAVYEQMPGSQA